MKNREKGKTMNAKRTEIRCKGLTKAGKHCGAAPTAGGLCFFHANPNKASELGRKGGKGNRHAGAESVDPLPRLNKAISLLGAVERLIADVYSRKLELRVAAVLTPLLSLQLRAIETADVERRIGELEKQSAEAKRAETSDGEGDE
jgi:general stress protein YciG